MDLKTSFRIANRLKSERTRAGLSHAKLSDAIREKYGISISVDSLKGYEVEKENQSKTGSNIGMRIEYLYYFADFYGVSTDYLLGRSDLRSKNEDVQTIHNTTGLSEGACSALAEIKQKPCSLAFVDSILKAPSAILEKMAKKQIAFLHVKKSLSPVIEQYKDQVKDKHIILDVSIDGEKLPQVPIQDLNTYALFDLWLAFSEFINAL